MPRPCTVCQRDDRASIDAALVTSTPNRRIATLYGLTEAAVRRHAEAHLPSHLARAQGAQDVAQADDLLAQVRALQAKAQTLLEQAERQGDLRTALQGVRESRACLELLAKLLGELDDRPQLNVLVTGEWLAVRSALLTALAEYPAARVRVATALAALESWDGTGR